MSACLLDINVLIALFDPSHLNHEAAHDWFRAHRKRGWATCPITVNGCVRVLSNPAYPTVEARPEEVVSHLRILCAAPDHEFWPEGLSLLDERLFRPQMITGHQIITDIYLVGLVVRRQAKLVTFDRSIPLRAVIGAQPRHIELLG